MLRHGLLALIVVILGFVVGFSCRTQAGKDAHSVKIAEKPICKTFTTTNTVEKKSKTRRERLDDGIESDIAKLMAELPSAPKNANCVHFFLAENHILAGKYLEALQDIEAQKNLYPPIRQNILSRIYNGLEQYDDALSELSDHKNASTARAYALLKLNRLEQSIKECNRCLKLWEPELAYLIRAQSYEALGKHKEAVADYSRSLFKKTPDEETFEKYISENYFNKRTELYILHNAEVYNRRASCYAKLGNHEKARADQNLAINLGFFPDSNVALVSPVCCP